jgi:hypothetical protein
MSTDTQRLALPDFWLGTRWTPAGVVAAALTLPIVYSLLLPFLLLDLWVQLYQAATFPVLGIAPVRRRAYVVIDRHRLGYLNPVQKANCLYCGYVNGLIAFVREVAARTEQFWCPIRHQTAVRGRHARYRRFVPYGDAAAFRRALPALRRELANGPRPHRHRRR